jgi:hypothetical protein
MFDSRRIGLDMAARFAKLWACVLPVTRRFPPRTRGAGEGWPVCAKLRRWVGDADMVHGLIIVSRDRPELFQTLVDTCSRNGIVEILLDRRQGKPWTGRGDRPQRRARSNRDRILRERGFIVVPQPNSGDTSH